MVDGTAPRRLRADPVLWLAGLGVAVAVGPLLSMTLVASVVAGILITAGLRWRPRSTGVAVLGLPLLVGYDYSTSDAVDRAKLRWFAWRLGIARHLTPADALINLRFGLDAHLLDMTELEAEAFIGPLGRAHGWGHEPWLDREFGSRWRAIQGSGWGVVFEEGRVVRVLHSKG